MKYLFEMDDVIYLLHDDDLIFKISKSAITKNDDLIGSYTDGQGRYQEVHRKSLFGEHVLRETRTCDHRGAFEYGPTIDGIKTQRCLVCQGLIPLAHLHRYMGR